MPTDNSIASRWAERGQRLAAALVRAFRAYANWLVSISWKRFALLSVLLIVASAILESLPPFSWRVGETLPARELTKDQACAIRRGQGPRADLDRRAWRAHRAAPPQLGLGAIVSSVFGFVGERCVGGRGGNPPATEPEPAGARSRARRRAGGP